MAKIFVLLCLIPVICYSQYQDTPNSILSNNKSYISSTSELCEKIHDQIPEKFKKNPIYQKSFYQYSNNLAYYLNNYINSSMVYHDKPVLENYLKSIMAKVLPNELKGDSLIDVFITRDGSLNAFSTGGGKIFINIGIMGSVSDEATLAYIILHELAHYYLNHQIESFYQNEKGKFDYGLLGYNDDGEFVYTIKQEYSCDSLTVLWMSKSNYSMQGALNSYNLEQNLNLKYLYGAGDFFNTHIKTKKQITNTSISLLKLINKYNNDSGKLFLINKELFYRLKEEAKPEVLKCLSDKMNYSECIINSFKYHIMDPQNTIYINFLMESIRKICFINKENWKKMFITSFFEDTISPSGLIVKRTKLNNLFQYFDPIMLNISNDETESIVAKFYWNGEPKFSTNEEAFNYFYQLSYKLKNPECFFSAALSYSQDTTKRNDFLRKYLSCTDILYKDYASDILYDTTFPTLSNKKLFVLTEIYPKVRIGLEEYLLLFSDDSSSQFKMRICDKINENTGNYKAISLSQIKQTNYEDYLLLKKLNAYEYRFDFNAVSLNSIFLDPDIYYAFKKFDVNNICFIEGDYLEIQKKLPTIDDCRKLLNQNISDFFAKDFGDRYFFLHFYNIGLYTFPYSRINPEYHYNQINDDVKSIDYIIKNIKCRLLQYTKR